MWVLSTLLFILGSANAVTHKLAYQDMFLNGQLDRDMALELQKFTREWEELQDLFENVEKSLMTNEDFIEHVEESELEDFLSAATFNGSGYADINQLVEDGLVEEEPRDSDHRVRRSSSVGELRKSVRSSGRIFKAEAGITLGKSGIEANVEASGPAGFLHADAGLSLRRTRLGLHVEKSKVLHFGPFGVEAKVEVEVGLTRIAVQKSVTPIFGHRDYNLEYHPFGRDVGFDIGYNRKGKSFGATVDLGEQGSFGAHIGCRTRICIINCVNIKLGRNC